MSQRFKRVLLLGASGFLGSRLLPRLVAAGYPTFRQVRSDAIGENDVHLARLDAPSLADVLRRLEPDVVLNLIAATDVDRCQREPEYAYSSNVETVVNLVDALGQLDRPLHLIHVSTDHLYGGTGPHSETAPHPVNVYALSKFAGELAARVLTSATILRVNFVGRSTLSTPRGLADWAVASLRNEASIQAFADSLFSPIDIDRLCYCMLRIIENPTGGTFNVGSHDGCSKEQFVRRLARLLNLSDRNVSTALLRTSSPFSRPLDTRMVLDKFERQFQIQLPSMSEVVDSVAMEYQG